MHSQRSWRRSEHLLLCCQLEDADSFSQMHAEDCFNCRAWLTDLARKTPQESSKTGWKHPAEQCLVRVGIPRGAANLRPFEGSMAKTWFAQDVTILRSLFNFLFEGPVVDGNPWLLMGKAGFSGPFGARDNQFTRRSLTGAQRNYLLSGLDLEDEIDAEVEPHFTARVGKCVAVLGDAWPPLPEPQDYPGAVGLRRYRQGR